MLNMTEHNHKLKLSKVRIRNFINFEDVDIEFNGENVFQFVGCNGSGKTSMLEAIRRCTESQSNHSFSTIPDMSKKSIVICTFKGPIQNQIIDVNEKNERQDNPLNHDESLSEKLISIYISWYQENGKRSAMKAIIFRNSGRISSEILCTKLSETKEILWTTCKRIYGDHILEAILEDDCCTEFIESSILKQHKLIEQEKTPGEKSLFDERFRDLVKIEFLYSFRGISKIQSSDQMPNLTAAEHFRDGTERSFIITKFLEGKNDDYDYDLEKNIFTRLTPDEEFSFQFTGKQTSRLLEVKDNRTLSTISILKTPVGVLEAKYLSITLSKKRSGIVIIEEPGRGMHPDMIRRMIYLVFQDREIMSNKMVIITTHDKSFLTPFTVGNTFLCKKRNEKTREVKPLANIEASVRNRKRSVTESPSQKQTVVEKDKYHKRESVECRFLAAIVFSQRIIFLEGESDFTLIETIKQLLITKKNLMESFIGALRNEYEKGIGENAEKDIAQFLASLNVEMMNGVKNMKKINDICYYLGLQENRFFLVDYDVLGNIDKTLSLDFSNLEWFNLQILEGNGVFVWDNDAVEISINESLINGNQTEDKGIQCPGILKQDKLTGAGVPPKPGTLEDVIVRFSLQHDKIYHFGNRSCRIQNCNGLVKLLENKEIANLKPWSSYAFTIEKYAFDINVFGKISIDETGSLCFIQEGNEQEKVIHCDQTIDGEVVIKGEGIFRTCRAGNIDLSKDPEKKDTFGSWYTHCDGKAFSLVQDNGKRIVCTDNTTMQIKIHDIKTIQSVSKKGWTKYRGEFDIAIESETRSGKVVKKCVMCTEPGIIWKEEKPVPQSHKKLCMTEKFLLQNTLTHSDVLEVVEMILKCSIEYREGQIWRFLRFLADKALNRQTKIHIHDKGDKCIQTVEVTD